MKKKLQLKKEVVSILDRKQMNFLTKGGLTTNPHETQEICTKTLDILCFQVSKNVCGTIKTEGCQTQLCPVTQQGCNPISENTKCDPEIETRNINCQAETDACDFSALNCVTNDGCYCAASKDTCF